MAKSYLDSQINLCRFYQVLNGAVGATLYQNEAEVKFHMEIDHQISPTLDFQSDSLQMLQTTKQDDIS